MSGACGESPTVQRPYVVGLGANLGDRLETLRSALASLGGCGEILAVSWIYETEPWGPPQPDFLNAAALLRSAIEPEALLERLLDVERSHGRERRERWGPRTLDLDVLYSPELVLDTPRLHVPHPHLTERAFALLPLLDVAPDAEDPRTKIRYADTLAKLGRHGVRRLDQYAPGTTEWAG